MQTSRTKRHQPALQQWNEAFGDDRGVTLTEMLVMMVVLLGVMAIVVQIFTRSYTIYEQQRQFVDARHNSSAAVDMMVRLLRSAETIQPDPDGNTVLDSVQVVADWNPKDGDTTDPYEDVRFTTAGGTLFKQEPADGAPVPFADRIQSIAFAYRDPAGAPLATPWTANQARLGYVTVSVQATPVDGMPGRLTVTAASIRSRE